MTDNSVLIDVIGWIGAVAILVAYALVSTTTLEGNSTPYQLVNLAGGACLIVNTIYYRAYPVASRTGSKTHAPTGGGFPLWRDCARISTQSGRWVPLERPRLPTRFLRVRGEICPIN